MVELIPDLPKGDIGLVAMVSDADWIRHAISVSGWMMPGDVKLFPLVDRDAAVGWLAG